MKSLFQFINGANVTTEFASAANLIPNNYKFVVNPSLCEFLLTQFFGFRLSNQGFAIEGGYVYT